MLRHRLFSLINAIWAIPTVMIIRILKPIVFIRIGQLYAGRIGHFVPDVMEHVVRKSISTQKSLDIYYLFGTTCNQQWKEMASQKLQIKGGWLKYLWHWNQILPWGNAHNIPQSYTKSRDPLGLFAKYQPTLKFTPEEITWCTDWMKEKGWNPGDPFVCLNVRDAEYMKVYDENKNKFAQESHDYRNSKIETYIPAVEWLTEQGTWVIRMGKLAESQIGMNNQKVIDYAFEKDKSDLLDVWLFANCTGCISTASGPDWISVIYGRITLFVNALPLGLLFSSSRSFWVPKNLFWTFTGRELNLTEYISHNLMDSLDYKEMGIKIVDLTPNEIMAAVQEFWGTIMGSWENSSESINQQENFWRKFKEWKEFAKFHGWIHPESRIGSAWLKSKPANFFE